MTGLGRSIKSRTDKIVPKELRKADPLEHYFDKAVNKTRFGPKKPQPAPVIPLPDEDAIDQATRRRRSRRLGSRATTVLSGGDTDPVGDVPA